MANFSQMTAQYFDRTFVRELVNRTEKMQPIAAAGFEDWAPDHCMCPVNVDTGKGRDTRCTLTVHGAVINHRAARPVDGQADISRVYSTHGVVVLRNCAAALPLIHRVSQKKHPVLS